MDLNILKQHNSIPGAKKVLFAPLNTLMIDYHEAFIDNGFELHSFNFFDKWDHRQYTSVVKGKVENMFINACKDIQPDWVFMLLDHPHISGKAILEAKKACPGAIFTNWTGDVRNGVKPGVEELGKVVDITLIVGTGQIDMYKERGLKRVEFLQTGYNIQKHFPLPDDKRASLHKELEHDVVFCANNFGAYPGSPLRVEVATKLSKIYGSRFGLYGNGWETLPDSARGAISYPEQNRVYNGSKVVISINNFNNIDMYFSARQLNAMVSGTITVSCYIPGLENYFENGKDLVWFRSADECTDLVKYYLDHEEEARKIGASGSKKVSEHHTKFARIKEMKERLGF